MAGQSKASKSEFVRTASHFEKGTSESQDNLWMLFFSHPFLSRQGKEPYGWGTLPASTTALLVCINSHIRSFNLLTSKCANTQLAGTKPASAEDGPLPSPPLCIRRADVSCTVTFWVAAGWGEQWFWPLLREGTRTCQQPKGLWSFGFMEKVSAFSASAVVPQQPFWIQHLKSYNLTLNYRQSSGELLWLLGAARRETHAKHKNSTVSVLDLQACI